VVEVAEKTVLVRALKVGEQRKVVVHVPFALPFRPLATPVAKGAGGPQMEAIPVLMPDATQTKVVGMQGGRPAVVFHLNAEVAGFRGVLSAGAVCSGGAEIGAFAGMIVPG